MTAGGGPSAHSPWIEVAPGLFLIPLDQPMAGFHHFISAWACIGEENFLVDVGPASTSHHLVDTLRRLGVDHLDAIFLTHIHIDHAGGIGQVAGAFAPCPVYCHPSAVDHLADPTRLWEGSLKILKETALAYGSILPVDRNRVRSTRSRLPAGVEVVETPGHAVHHVSYRIGPWLFCGEAAGVLFSIEGKEPYLRPATPVRFLFDVFVQSIERLRAMAPDAMCYGHFGFHRHGVRLLDRHRAQLEKWREMIAGEMRRTDRAHWVRAASERLLKDDPDLAAFPDLDADVQIRERGFLENSVRGFLDFLSAPPGH